MNKSVKRIACLALSAATAFSLVGCGDGGKGEQKYNTETRPVVFSIEALDGNFNPFFSTSLTDSNVAGMTQIGMLTTDKDGNVAYGKDEAVVTLDLKETMLNADGNVVSQESDAAYTEYEFILKNGIKFSDGQPLTVKDVLFNLYVYLDPMYMGSATIYSTDIVGLKAYRLQDPDASEETDANSDASFYAEADQRIDDIVAYLDGEEDTTPVGEESRILKDIQRVKELFREEAESDWTMSVGSVENYKNEYNFTEDWQIYYFTHNVVRIHTNAQGKKQKFPEGHKDAGKYITNLDVEAGLQADGGNYNPDLAAEIENAQSEQKIAEYITKYDIKDEENGQTKEEIAREMIIKDTAIDTVYEACTATEDKIIEILYYWATGSNIRDEFAAEAKSEYYQNKKDENDGELAVKNISGIRTYKTTKDFSGKDLGASHDVLKIKINRIDPKAIWNFAFSVAPMHYYASGSAALAAAQAATVPSSAAEWANYSTFGVEMGDEGYFKNVLQSAEKNGKPVGAGVYMATNESSSGTVDRTNFYKNNWVYYERNPYFYTVLGDGTDTSNNAKIKYFRYRVVGSDKILSALETKIIDFGEPNATVDNVDDLDAMAHINHIEYPTNGYGYVGINPKYVPDLEVRQAIMMAMNTTITIKGYYSEELASLLYRPMSTESWVYDYAYQNGVEQWKDIAYTTDKTKIEKKVQEADWVKDPSTGLYTKDGKTLTYTFTIAGGTTDHPAFNMFMDAAKTLNSCGFDITVITDVSALTKLATGQLAVWAAAWSSTVDPDLYQVYHKDSKATSIKNWGYKEILEGGSEFKEEQTIIKDLSKKIEEARTMTDKPSRAAIYEEALDLIMQLAIELPTYQRNDCTAYNKEVIDANTVNKDASATAGVTNRLWELNYN